MPTSFEPTRRVPPGTVVNRPVRLATKSPSTGPAWARRAVSLGLALLVAVIGVALGRPPTGAAEAEFRRIPAPLRLLGRVSTASLPKSVTASPDGRFLVVAGFGQRDTRNLDVFDAGTLQRVAAIDVRGNPVESLFSRDGRRLFVSSFSAARVMEIDFPARRVVRELPAGLDPKTLALSPDERTLYVVNWRSRDVSVVDLATGTQSTRAHVGPHPRGIVVRPDGRVVVASTDADELVEFDARGTRRRVVRTCRFPRELVARADALFVTCSGLSRVWRLDPESLGRTDGANVGRNPRSAGASTDGRHLAVANFDGRSVSLLDLVDRTHAILEAPDVGRIVGVDVLPGAQLRVVATSWETRELLLFGPRDAPSVTPGRRGVRPLSPAPGSR